MTDPEGGATLQEKGASAERRGEGETLRRGMAGQAVAETSSAPAGSLEDRTSPSGSAARSEDGDHQKSRKRKRRRRRGAAQPPGPAVPAEPAVAEKPPVETEEKDGPRKPGRKRRRGRGRNAHQVRPLSPAGPTQRPSPTPQPAAEAPPRPPSPEKRLSAPSVQAAGHEPDLYAALDLGTNNCRLLIAQPTKPGQFRVVDAFSRIVRLGEGLASSTRLSEEAMERAVEALRICAGKLSGRRIRRRRLIATEACRAADNGEDFLARVTGETGLDLEIINRETEARLAVSGCSSLVGREARSVVLFDIGGGSSEIAVIRIGENRSSRLANHITHWTSLPVGVVTLSERHGGRDVTPGVFEAMVSEVEIMLAKFDCPPVHDGAGVDGDFHLIGTSGTVTTLAGVHLDLPRYDRRRVDGLWLSDAEVSAMQAKLLGWGYGERASNPCIGPDRADLVLAGCAILEAIRRRWPASRMRVADRGLREGLLTDMMADDGVWRRGRGRRPFRSREH